MNLKHRKRIAKIAAKIFGIQLNILVMAIKSWTKLAWLRTEHIERRTRKLVDVTRSLNGLTERKRSLSAEFKALESDKLPFKNQLVARLTAVRAALESEGEALRRKGLWLYRGPYWATSAVWVYAQESLDEYIASAQTSCGSLNRILSRLESPTFYWDLLLWFLIPGLRSEELLGDLNEEFLLRLSDEGEANAKAWYQHQAVSTLMRYLWKRVERFAAIATLIDFLDRWLRK